MLGVGRHRADRERPVGGELDALQVVEPVQVDEHVGRGGARLHHVDQGLAAGERAGAVVRREDREGLRDGRRLCVFDLPQQHVSDPMTRSVLQVGFYFCRDDSRGSPVRLAAARRSGPRARRGSPRGSRAPSRPATPRRCRARTAREIALEVVLGHALLDAAARAAAPGCAASRARRCRTRRSRARRVEQRQVELVVVGEHDDRGAEVGLDAARAPRPARRRAARRRSGSARASRSARGRRRRSSSSRAASRRGRALPRCRPRRRRAGAAAGRRRRRRPCRRARSRGSARRRRRARAPRVGGPSPASSRPRGRAASRRRRRRRRP